jgi:nitrogen fixation NifU-like protein
VRVNSDSGLQDLYQEVVLDHSRKPRNFRAIEGARKAEGHNPLCGDRLTVYVRIEDDRVADVGFQGSGCAIMKASASLMTDSVRGRTVAEAHALLDRFLQIIALPPGRPVEPFGTLSALAGVRQFPTRVKCVTLAWHALRAAMQGGDASVSTE